MTELAQEGTPLQAKAAATILARHADAKDNLDILMSDIVEHLSIASPSRLVTLMAALGRLARYAPEPFEIWSDSVTSFVLDELLMKSGGAVPMDDDAEDERLAWGPDEDITDADWACLAALKVLVNRVIALADSPDAMTAATPVFNLLNSLLDSDPAITASQRSCARDAVDVADSPDRTLPPDCDCRPPR